MLYITVQEMFSFFFICTFISISPLNEAVYSSLSVHGSLSLLGFTVFCYSRNQQVFYSAVLNWKQKMCIKLILTRLINLDW